MRNKNRVAKGVEATGAVKKKKALKPTRKTNKRRPPALIAQLSSSSNQSKSNVIGLNSTPTTHTSSVFRIKCPEEIALKSLRKMCLE